MIAPFFLLLAAAGGGCDPSIGEPAPDEVADETVEPPPADALEAALRALGSEQASFMIRDGSALRGRGETGTARDYGHIMHPGWCYKVVGLGGEGVEDLEVRVYDPNDVMLERDTTDAPRLVIGRVRPICPAESGTYRIATRVVRGRGEFAVQVYRSL